MKKWKDRVRAWIQELELTEKEKKGLLCMGILVLLVALGLQVRENQPFNGILYRNTYGAGTKEEEYQVQVNGETISLEIEIQEEQYTKEELDEIFGTCLESLDDSILGENETTDYVCYDLNLIKEIEGTGIQVVWSWEPYELLNLDGEIQEEVLADLEVDGEGTILELEGILSYGDAQVIYVRSLNVFPQEMNELAYIESQLLEEIGRIDEEMKEESYVVLPTIIQGEESYDVVWYETKSYSGWILLSMGWGVLLLLLLRKKEAQKEESNIRKEDLERAYPRMIQTFALYMGAGMTAKNVWKRMVQEYEEKGEQGYLQREMKRTYYEMNNGISEGVCYEAFARRCGLRCYQRMGLLLSQNLRKGTKGLTDRLEQEATESFQIRKNKARMAGEMAGTKLLMPMFLMLAVVLVIVIIPAFVSIQI